MKPLNFMTIGDRSFFHTIAYSVKQTAKFYPDARFYIYDMGFSASQVAELRDGNTTVVPWANKTARLPARAYARVLLPLMLKGPRWFIAKGPARLHRNLRIFAGKPKCILDCLRRSDGDVVFLDGDAFLVNDIDAVVSEDFDVGVTMRRLGEIIYPRKNGECRVLNVGVMVFKGGARRLESFMRRWSDEVKVTDDFCIEQTALTNLVATTRDDIYDDFNKIGILDLGDDRIKIKVLPCETYNFNWIEEGFDLEKNRILHFKGGRHSVEKFEELKRRIGLDEVEK